MQSAWLGRVNLEEMAQVLQRLVAGDLLNDETPSILLHDLDRVRARLRMLRGAFPASSLHAVAIKANPLVELLRIVVAEGAGLEAASLEEVHLARAAGCPPRAWCMTLQPRRSRRSSTPWRWACVSTRTISTRWPASPRYALG